MKTSRPLDRRRFLSASALGSLGILGVGATTSAQATGACENKAPSRDLRYPIGVCDWMILKRQKLGAFERAAEIGVDGLELDMGGLGSRPTFNSKLMEPIERRKFLDAAREHRLGICSIAMSGFYAQDFSRREVEPMVRDTLNTANLMGAKTVFLPLGVQGDLVQFPDKRPAIVERLKRAGEMAEAADVVIGIETALDAAGEVELLEEIGSPAIRSYFNFANALQNRRDLRVELQTLGAQRICQIHATDEDKVWLQNNPRIDMPKVKVTLDAMGWKGWLVLERSRDASRVRDVVANYGANARFLKSVFQRGA